jgi:hypothetical protein
MKEILCVFFPRGRTELTSSQTVYEIRREKRLIENPWFRGICKNMESFVTIWWCPVIVFLWSYLLPLAWDEPQGSFFLHNVVHILGWYFCQHMCGRGT